MNILTISGNLARDCRTAQPGGKSVCNFTVANTTGFGDKEHTEFIECAVWGKRAEGNLPQYLIKGQKVFLSGEVRISQREHEGKHYANMSVFVRDLELAGAKSEAQQSQQPAQQAAPKADAFADDNPFA